MAVLSIDVVWARIRAHEGETFRQVRGGEFMYTIASGQLRPDRTNRNLPRSDFERAVALVPLARPGQIQRLQGPSYIFAVLMDERIRGGDW